MQRGRVLEVAQTSQDAPHALLTSVEEGLARIKALLTPQQPTGLPSLLDTLLERFVPRTGRLVLLKQFGDVGNSGAACYQAIVEAPMTVTRWGSFPWLPGSHRLTLPQLASHPIADDLGIEDQQFATHAFRTEYDFVLEAGTTIWSAQ